MVYDGGARDQEGSSSASPAAARAGRPPRPGRDKGLGVRHPLKHRLFRAGGAKMIADAGGASSSGRAAAEAREVGEATVVAEATATVVGASKESERPDQARYICGGWKSEDGTLNCGYSSFRGHGGSRAAEYLKEHLFENLLKHPAFITDPKSAISETYKKTDSDFLGAETNNNREDGSTASTAILVGNHLYVANVGDSRAIISKAGKVIALSVDHKPNRSDEQKRIENAGGTVIYAGTWRVNGVLAMSRAFGNRLLKRFVVAEPEIQEQAIDDEVEFLILASDGLWDVVPNEHAIGFVKAEGPEAAARKLTEIAFTRGSTDNITCIVVDFQHDKMNKDSPSSNDKS